jgi:hypothetical protein
MHCSSFPEQRHQAACPNRKREGVSPGAVTDRAENRLRITGSSMDRTGPQPSIRPGHSFRQLGMTLLFSGFPAIRYTIIYITIFTGSGQYEQCCKKTGTNENAGILLLDIQ